MKGFLVLVLIFFRGIPEAYPQQPVWGSFQRDHCTGMGIRQFSARLWNISGSWEVACANTSATVAGQFFPKPTRCVNKGALGMWGEFDVSDATCPNWGAFQDDNCVGAGRRQFSALLKDVPIGISWENACLAESATIKGQFFPSPTRCINKGLFGMWGEFEVSDNTCSNPDLVQFSRAVPSSKVGIILDGETDGPISLNDQTFVETADASGVAKFSVGPIVPTLATNEIIAFSSFIAPTYLETPWTTARDTYGTSLDQLIEVPITMWILAGPFTNQTPIVSIATAGCGAIWQNERAGLKFGTIVFRDATTKPSVGNYLNWPWSSPLDFTTLKRDIGFDPNRLNVYWLNTVNGGSGNGLQPAGEPIIIIGRNADAGLLAHELGHAFVLEHVDKGTFDANNVMVGASSSRQFFTEGQTFRMHFHPSSAVNAVYRARPGRITRVCPAATADGSCPNNNKRIWADGSLPPN